MKDVYLINLRDRVLDGASTLLALIEHLEGGGERGPIMERRLKDARCSFDAITDALWMHR